VTRRGSEATTQAANTAADALAEAAEDVRMLLPRQVKAP